MSTILVKIFATALTLSQVTVHPDAVKTAFDPATDTAEVARLLTEGCTQMRRAFDIEDVNLDDLIATAMDDPQAIAGDVKVLQGLSFGDLHLAYRQFCKDEAVEKPAVDLAEVIAYYNEALKDLPDHTTLKDLKLPRLSTVLDGNGERFAEIAAPDSRRIWVPLAAIPEHVRQRLRRGGRQALLRAPGRRRARRRPRLRRQPDAAGPAAGRLDDHAAGGEEPARRRRRHLRAQDARDGDRLAHRAQPVASRRSWSSISTRSISAAAPGASRWRRAAISANRRRT